VRQFAHQSLLAGCRFKNGTAQQQVVGGKLPPGSNDIQECSEQGAEAGDGEDDRADKRGF